MKMNGMFDKESFEFEALGSKLKTFIIVREDTHKKKVVFLVVGPLRI